MYFEPKEVISLVKCIIEFFSNVTLLFDTIPKWMVHKTKKGWYIESSITLSKWWNTLWRKFRIFSRSRFFL